MKTKIFSHYLDFTNEAVLQKKYGPNSLDPLAKDQTITVKEVFSYRDFPVKTEWDTMAGQSVRYLTFVPIKKNIHFFDWALEIQHCITLIWESKTKQICYVKGEAYTIKQFEFWLLHTFIPMVLELEEVYKILHVGSVEVEGKPIVFSAASFGGKSTLTDYFLSRGHTLLSDDSLGIENRANRYYAVPSYPFHRPYRELETLGYRVDTFATEPKPIHAVYRLVKTDADADICIQELIGIEKFRAFHFSTFIEFPFMKKERFDFFTKMANVIPVYNISIPWDKKRLPEVYDAILKKTKEPLT